MFCFRRLSKFPENLDIQLHDVLHWIDATRPTRLAVVMDRNTEKHCLPLLTPLLPPHTEFLCMSVVGESVKSKGCLAKQCVYTCMDV